MSNLNHFFSGTPRNDAYQRQEDSQCTHRLFSCHDSYLKAVMKWMANAREHEKIPHTIMLDSGAFTAWNKGHSTSLDEVYRAYDMVMEIAHDMFAEIWMVNLDKIPGECGRDPTPEELDEAVEISDVNLIKLQERFGERILPVFHQGESTDRLHEVKAQADYICISPRNDMPEKLRVRWSMDVHAILDGKKTHGLATTGNNMMRNVPWYSVDSAAWILRAGYGMAFFCIDGKLISPFFTYESDRYKGWDEHFDTLNPVLQQKVLAALEPTGFTVEDLTHNARARNIVSMNQIQKFVDEVKTPEAATMTLFGV